MMLVRRLARPLLAGFFVSRGIQLLRHPQEAIPYTAKTGVPVAERVRFLPTDPLALSRVDGAVQTVGGLLLAAGRVPRLASLALAVPVIPAALARHPFWSEEDPDARASQQSAFLSHMSILG